MHLPLQGRGHEVSDLQRLLEMYKRWGERIYAGVPFDHFIELCEKLSGTAMLKNELREMRAGLLKVFEDANDRIDAQDGPVQVLIVAVHACMCQPALGLLMHF